MSNILTTKIFLNFDVDQITDKPRKEKNKEEKEEKQTYKVIMSIPFDINLSTYCFHCFV